MYQLKVYSKSHSPTIYQLLPTSWYQLFTQGPSITSLDSQSTSQFHQSLHQRYQSSQEPCPPLKLGEEYYHSIGSCCELLRWVVWSIKTRFTVNRWKIIGSLSSWSNISENADTKSQEICGEEDTCVLLKHFYQHCALRSLSCGPLVWMYHHSNLFFLSWSYL